MKITGSVFSISILVVTLCCCKQSDKQQEKIPPATSRFHEGEVWSFHTLPDELPNARLTIARIELHPKFGPIIYVAISGVRQQRAQSQIFFPFSEEALDRSVIALISDKAQLSADDLTNFQKFYQIQGEGVASGGADPYFTKSVAEVLKNYRTAR